jgi:hypothetical protein
MALSLDNPRTVLLHDASRDLAPAAERLAQLLPHASTWAVGQNWPTGGEPPALVIMAVTQEKATAVLSELDRRRLDVVCACLPGNTDNLSRLGQRVRHIHSCLLAPWRYHWAICRLREILTCGLFGDISRADLLPPTEIGPGLLAPYGDFMAGDLGKWLGVGMVRTTTLGQEETCLADSRDQTWRLRVDGSCGDCDIAFRENGWGEFHGKSNLRHAPWSYYQQGPDMLASALGALVQTAKTNKGWMGFPLIR